MLKLCKVVMFGMVLVISSELKAPLMAADKAATDKTAINTQPATLSYEGKVMVVDRAAHTITVEIQKRLYLFKFAPNTTVVRKGKKVKIEDVVAGQQISLQLIQTTDGQVQIGSVDIGSGGKAEPAGSGPLSAPNSGASTYSGQGAIGSPPRPNVSPYN